VAFFVRKYHIASAGHEVDDLRTALEALNFVGPDGRPDLSLASSGLLGVIAALAALRSGDRPPHVTGVIGALRTALRSSARLPYTFSSFNAVAAAPAATWEDTCGRILFDLDKKQAAGKRVSVDDLHAIIKLLKGLSQQFDTREALLDTPPASLPADLVLRVGAHGGGGYASARGSGHHAHHQGRGRSAEAGGRLRRGHFHRDLAGRASRGSSPCAAALDVPEAEPVTRHQNTPGSPRPSRAQRSSP
jgi:hypothetical protein